MKKENLFHGFIIIFILLIIYSIQKRSPYVLDLSASVIILIFLFKSYKEFNLNNAIFSLIFLSLLSHNLGVFGFYNNSPVYFQYDHLTHFIGGFSLSLFFLNYFSRWSKNKAIIILLALCTALGVGSVIEIIEYLGYLVFGQGDGLFYFGGTGDLGFKQDPLIGAWINSSLDMIFNLIGGLFGIIIYFFMKLFK